MEENDHANKKNKAWGNSMLFLGIILLVANACWYLLKVHKSADVKRRIDSLAHVLDTAGAHFEIGYGEINCSLYKTMRSPDPGNNNSLVYSALNNQVDQLLMSGHLDPTWTEIEGDNSFLKEYISQRKAHKLKQREPGVICLIIKQTGKGKAEHVKLNFNFLTIDFAQDMYDPSDISLGTDSVLTPEARKKYHVIKQQVDLGEMDTGAAKLIPLYITNWFDDATPDEGDGSTTLNFTGGPMWVPTKLSYLQKKSDGQEISLDDVLKRPIQIAR